MSLSLQGRTGPTSCHGGVQLKLLSALRTTLDIFTVTFCNEAPLGAAALCQLPKRCRPCQLCNRPPAVQVFSQTADIDMDPDKSASQAPKRNFVYSSKANGDGASWFEGSSGSLCIRLALVRCARPLAR